MSTDSLFDLPFPPKFSLRKEKGFAKSFDGRLAGVDEAGRGPWAGPVVTAAVILDYKTMPDGLNDSKKLSEARREVLFEEILASGALVGIASASAATIDRINIRAATLAAMTRAVHALAVVPSMVIVDGKDVPPGLGVPGQNLIKGDARCLAVAAASIVAKVTRDRMMERLDKVMPQYGFAKHKGYGVPAHAAALEEFGPTTLHRLSFRPIRELSNGLTRD